MMTAGQKDIKNLINIIEIQNDKIKNQAENMAKMLQNIFLPVTEERFNKQFNQESEDE